MTADDTDGPRVISDARDLLGLTELSDVCFYEASARRTDAQQEETTATDIDIRVRTADTEIEVRCKAELETNGVAFVADAGAVFVFSEALQIEQAAIDEFVSRVGVMTVYPFLRESFSSSAARFGVDRPILKLLRPGEIVPVRESPTG